MRYEFDFEFEGKSYQLAIWQVKPSLDALACLKEKPTCEHLQTIILYPDWRLATTGYGDIDVSGALKDHVEQLLQRIYANRIFL
jgi:hypothetical protein